MVAYAQSVSVGSSFLKGLSSWCGFLEKTLFSIELRLVAMKFEFFTSCPCSDDTSVASIASK